jgi:APA family basic amino acid/polyamine antiporter
MQLFRLKPITEEKDIQTAGLRRCLTAFDLTLLGIGAIIGAGIFVVTGIAAATQAGPAVTLSYLIASLACGFSALSYAELASSVGGCGSAYGYAYAGLGEFIAWVIGWDLILEYGISTSAVAIGWSGYVDNALMTIGINIPDALTKTPLSGGIVDLPAMLIVFAITALLAIGMQQSARFNSAMVFVKLLAIAVFILVASFHFNIANWHPFAPFGWHGIMGGAALIFFAYIGFDAVSTAAEEAIDPQRDMPIGIIASLAICALIYVVVSGLLTGLAHYTTLNVKSPVAEALLSIGQNAAAGLIAAGAIAGLTTVVLVMFYGLTRIFLSMARDGLLPPIFSHVNKRTQTPVPVIVASGLFIALCSGFAPMQAVVELVNIGTLAAFAIVCGGVVVMRMVHPDLPRPFKTPFNPLIPLLGILSCGYLMISLPVVTWLRFAIWMAVGVVVYFIYSYRHSKLNK